MTQIKFAAGYSTVTGARSATIMSGAFAALS